MRLHLRKWRLWMVWAVLLVGVSGVVRAATNSTTAGALEVVGSSSRQLTVLAPFTGDDDNDGSVTVEYGTDATWGNGDDRTACSGLGGGSPRVCCLPKLDPGATYHIRVTYTDPDGVAGTEVQTATASTSANDFDTSPPTLSIIKPLDGGVAAGNSDHPIVIDFTVYEAKTEVSIAPGDVQVFIDGTAYNAAPNPKRPGYYKYSWSTPTIGWHSVTARAKDTSGNVGYAPTVRFYVNSTAVNSSGIFAGDGTLLVRDNDNQICWDCHRRIMPHSSASTGTRYGNWSLTCRQCHTPHNTKNIFLVKQQIKTPNSGQRNVDFRKATSRDATGPNTDYGFTNRANPGGGPCEVCHTRTANRNDNTPRYRNTGTGPDDTQASGAHAYPPFSSQPCINCHNHKSGFAHGPGAKGTGCVACHGHEPGTMYDPDMTYPYTPGDKPSGGKGTIIPHSTHTESWLNIEPSSAGDDDKRGPAIYCSTCHDTGNFPRFNAGTDINGDGEIDLSETSVCNSCHSPQGSYNGVDDAVIGAKKNWHTGGVYNTDGSLKTGKEKWCAGCHDESPSMIPNWNNITAPNVIGDESGAYKYGTGWGFFKTGHGLPSTEKIPSTGGIKNGPGRICVNCHDSRVRHIDGNHRTFDCSDGCDDSEYQQSYRIKLINGLNPMKIPYPQNDSLTDDDFRLCFSCHDPGPFLSADNTNTNMKTQGVNRHNYHLSSSTMNTIVYPADYNYSGSFNSRPTCVACHNVHGTTNLAMIRNGKLIGREPGLEIWYNNDDIVKKVGTTSPPDPENVPLSSSNGAVWIGNSADNLCANCHGNPNTARTYRDPFQSNVSQAPKLEWTGKTGYVSDGVNPDTGPSGSFTFRVKYTDTNNDAPNPIEVWVDLNDNGTYEPGEKFSMSGVDNGDVNFANGRVYSKAMTLGPAGDNVISYRFHASDGTNDATGLPATGGSIVLLNSAPTLAWTGEGYFESDGVNPNVGGNGGNYQFRVDYADRDNQAPSSIQVWVDVNDNGVYESGEKLAMTAVDAGDTNYADGKRYTKTLVLDRAGDGVINYRFYASDGSADATGAPVSGGTITVSVSANTPPVLDWVAEGCRTDGVLPVTGLATGEFEFKVRYTDLNNQCPTSGGSNIQVWIDANDNGVYEAGEKHNLTAENTADTDCTDGKAYRTTRQIAHAGDGSLSYRFYAFDGSGSAVGAPATGDRQVTVVSTSNAKGVRPSGGGDPWYSSIQSAIDNAPQNGTVLVYPGTYGNIVLNNISPIDNGKTVRSVCGADSTVINSSGTVVLAQSVSGVTVDGFSITGGTMGVYVNAASVTLANNRIHGNTNGGGAGGGVTAVNAAAMTITGSEIYSNSATAGGGIFFNAGSNYLVSNSVIRNNAATAGGGGGIFPQNTSVTITDTVIKDNTSTSHGAAAYMNGATATFVRSTVSGNAASGLGGAAYLANASSTINFENSIVANNRGTEGGGVYNNTGTLNIVNSTIADNQSTSGAGGAINSQYAAATIRNSILWGNLAATDGHSAYLGGGSMSVSDSVVASGHDGIFTNGPHFGGSATPTVSGYMSENDPNFVDAAGGNYHIKAPSDAMDNASADHAPADDIDGNSRAQGAADDIGADEIMAIGNNTPTLSWTGETNYSSDGINPESGAGGTGFTFRVDYTDPDNDAPVFIQVWIDANDNGIYEQNEKYDMTAVEAGDTNYADKKRYARTLTVGYAGDGAIMYRFHATDGENEATGAPVSNALLAVSNNVPTLSWAGESGYLQDGVNPDSGMGGGEFEFGIRYADADNTPPSTIEVWVDMDDSGTYESWEKLSMTAVDAGDADYTDGRLYTRTQSVPYAGDGFMTYRFHASDGKEDATGYPTTDRSMTVTLPAGSAPTLSWASAACLTDGVKPPIGAAGTDFEFMVSYSDADNQCASTIQVWIDENDNGAYEAGEKYAMTAVDPGDTNCADGKLYRVTRAIALAGDGVLNYRFHASDGALPAGGVPTSNRTFTVMTATKVRPDGGAGWYTTIQGGIDNIGQNGTVLVYPGTYGNIVLNNISPIDNGKTVRSVCGADSTVINSSGTVVLAQSVSGVTVDGFSITGGTMGVYVNAASVTLANNRIHGNTNGGGAGGGVTAVNAAALTITGSEIYSNSATAGGGIFFNAGSNYLVSNSVIRNNAATAGGGGGIFPQNTSVTITDTVIKDNTATSHGAAAYMNGATATFVRSTVSGNAASGLGGAAYLANASSTINFENSIAANNRGTQGGAIYNNGGTLNITNSTIADNQATSGSGGAILSCGTNNTVRNSIFWNNSATGSGHNAAKTCGVATFMTITDSNITTGSGYIDGGSINASGNIHPAQDPLFVGGGDYHIRFGSPVIDQANPAHAPSVDIDGDARPQGGGPDMGADEFFTTNSAPALTWTGEANYTTDGVNPDSATGGSSFEFRVDYTDVNNDAPGVIQVWVDANDNGTYEAEEKYAMTAVDGGDSNHADGRRYTKTLAIPFAGDGSLSYRFFAIDGMFAATGVPVSDAVVSVTNNIPTLSWTGEANYASDGVDPNSATGGANFTFRVDYTDADNTAAAIIQLWVDANDNGIYDVDEKYTMAAVDGGDVVYTDGKRYAKTLSIPHAGDGTIAYRFRASDGTSDATGAPTASGTLTVTPSANNAPTLDWTGEAGYTADGVNPDSGAGGSSFTFRVKYSDADNNAPTAIQVWIDANDNGTFEESEKHSMTADNAGDTVYTDGRLYTLDRVVQHVADGGISYRFYAYDGAAAATGTPTTSSTMTVVNPRLVPSQYGTIQAAINASVNGDIILVSNGTYSENIDYGSKVVTIKSVGGAANTTIQGNGGDAPVVKFNNAALTASAVLDGFTIDNHGTGGNNQRGIYIGSGATPTIRNSVIKGNSPANYVSGAGIYMTGGGATIENTTVGASGAANSGGRGAGLYAQNSAANVTITGSTFTYNTTGSEGGAIYLTNMTGTNTISGSTLSSNTAAKGGAIYNIGSPLAIAYTAMNNNAATYEGAALYASGAAGAVNITGGTMNNNTAANAAALYIISDADVTCTGGAISGNTSTGSYGAIWIRNAGSTLNLTKMSIAGNAAPQRGGAIYAESGTAVTITNGMLTGNVADDFSYSEGGAIHTLGTLTVYNSTISGNHAWHSGGGINMGGGAVSIKNSIVYGNTTTAGVGNQIDGTATVIYTDVEGGYTGSGTFDGDASGAGNINVNPNFVSPDPASSGNPKTTGDYHLKSGSPVANQGKATGGGVPANDIDGDSRPLGAGIDMGADEKE